MVWYSQRHTAAGLEVEVVAAEQLLASASSGCGPEQSIGVVRSGTPVILSMAAGAVARGRRGLESEAW